MEAAKCRELIRAAVDRVQAIDSHAHNLVEIESEFPFIKCFTEAQGEALHFAPHSLSFKKRCGRAGIGAVAGRGRESLQKKCISKGSRRRIRSIKTRVVRIDHDRQVLGQQIFGSREIGRGEGKEMVVEVEVRKRRGEWWRRRRGMMAGERGVEEEQDGEDPEEPSESWSPLRSAILQEAARLGFCRF